MTFEFSLPLVLGALWVISACVVAAFPMRLQYAPGVILLLAAPCLIAWIGAVHGALVAGVGVFALLSMFRRPLAYLARRAMSLPGGAE